MSFVERASCRLVLLSHLLPVSLNVCEIYKVGIYTFLYSLPLLVPTTHSCTPFDAHKLVELFMMYRYVLYWCMIMQI